MTPDVIVTHSAPGVPLSILLEVLPFVYIGLSAGAMYAIVKYLRKKQKRKRKRDE